MRPGLARALAPRKGMTTGDVFPSRFDLRRLQAAVSTSIPIPLPSLFTQLAIDLNEARWSSEMERWKALARGFPKWAIFEVHRASLGSIANCVKLEYLGDGSGNPARATMHLTADDPKGTNGGKEAQERSSGGCFGCFRFMEQWPRGHITRIPRCDARVMQGRTRVMQLMHA